MTQTVAPPPAHAGPAGGLCHMDSSRGTIPSRFAIEACFDGKTLVLRNNLTLALTVDLRGDARRLGRRSAAFDLAADATRLQSKDPNLLLPGDTLRISIGRGSASVGVRGSSSGGFYAIATTADTFFPAGKKKTKAVVGAFTSFVHEVDDDFDKYKGCIQNRNWIDQIGCFEILTRDVYFAIGRAVVTGGAKGLAAALLSGVTFAKWLDAQPEHVSRVLHSPPIELEADRQPVEKSSKSPPARPTVAPTPPPPPSPTPSLEVGSSFDDECVVAWPTAPTRTADAIELTMSCDHVPEDEFLFTAVIYGDPDLDIHPDSTAHVEGEVVSIAESDYGYRELVVEASSVVLH
ncbi:MAG TPA: hypothetical protein VFM94_00105 [Solirubrobacterales bacterium]|nr:hypothetical protein [Solirubrobacterales bacterium]